MPTSDRSASSNASLQELPAELQTMVAQHLANDIFMTAFRTGRPVDIKALHNYERSMRSAHGTLSQAVMNPCIEAIRQIRKIYESADKLHSAVNWKKELNSRSDYPFEPVESSYRFITKGLKSGLIAEILSINNPELKMERVCNFAKNPNYSNYTDGDVIRPLAEELETRFTNEFREPFEPRRMSENGELEFKSIADCERHQSRLDLSCAVFALGEHISKNTRDGLQTLRDKVPEINREIKDFQMDRNRQVSRNARARSGGERIDDLPDVIKIVLLTPEDSLVPTSYRDLLDFHDDYGDPIVSFSIRRQEMTDASKFCLRAHNKVVENYLYPERARSNFSRE